MIDSAAERAARRLAMDRDLLGRTSTAERVASLLRERIIDGVFAPGERLSEESIGAALQVSRNTLREAFRLLSHERLLVHQLNRGVFVRGLTSGDVVDLYRVRRLVECAAIREAVPPPPVALARLREALEEAGRATDEERWHDVGSANMRFHQGLVALAGSERLDEMMRQVLAELRLTFLAMSNPRAFHGPYVARNREILKLIEAGDAAGAERLLADYLADAERQLVEAHANAGE
ncbi:GntR family transcriptional regulator [Sphaerisporangium siamense]|uniref:DNA-binding GntR family transcriptional regulator n=1 Tax=Sphaerisporangium siamense TaxID=795645 RepID=A0A7W7D5G6_9ACTN|nr:GntR family transcriptional regulator [Sphaerisporangium siamense]MBB4700527.1 DNA-binding GntR family transcriptional regulator [Sphaerisporangium siamense]